MRRASALHESANPQVSLGAVSSAAFSIGEFHRSSSRFRLSRCEILQRGAIALGKALPNWPHIQTLDIPHNYIGRMILLGSSSGSTDGPVKC